MSTLARSSAALRNWAAPADEPAELSRLEARLRRCGGSSGWHCRDDRGRRNGLPVRTASPGDTGCHFDSGHDRQFDQYRLVADGFAVEAPCLAASRYRPLKEILASSLGVSARLCRECLLGLRAWRLDLVLAGGAVRMRDRDTVGGIRGGVRYGCSCARVCLHA